MGNWLNKQQREERDKRIVRLRLDGLKYRQISERLGVNLMQVNMALRKAGLTGGINQEGCPN